MADDKTKRFRLHVVKELYETEKDYTQHLEFTVTVLLEKARVKGQHDNTFTEEVVQRLFCNIEDILSVHQALMADLNICLKGGPSYLSRIAGVYLKYQEQFLIYRDYGKGNEAAQKLLYELEEDENFNAFFLACLLLGGRGDGTISTYLFKPVQRITKYPLLFRELEKYTPPTHPDYEATCEFGRVMRDSCFVINEAKRAVEKLDSITDWQATVEGWEGSKVTDTCNELIKEGSLIKISVGNTQERMFFLFDNLFVYCKKSLLSRSRPLLFRGRIPMENLDVEDIEDGTANYHTNGITVTNSWKVHNIAKDKWFVLIAKSKEEKKEWMDAIRQEKEKRKRSAARHGRAVRDLMVQKGDKLYHLMKSKSQLIRDQKARLRTYTKCFMGSEFVHWLNDQGEVGNSDEGVLLGQHLLENGIIHHVNDKHQFKNSDLLYRFRYDDGTYRAKYDSKELSARSIRMYCRLHGLFDPLIKDQKVGIRSVRCVVNAQKLIEWMQEENDITSREEGVALGREFIATGILRHATDDQDFKDTNTCYRFTADDLFQSREASRKSSTAGPRNDFIAKQQQSCITLTVPYSKGEAGYGVSFKAEFPLPVSIKFASPHAQCHGVLDGQTVVIINGQYMTSALLPSHPSLLSLLSPTQGGRAPPALHLTVLRMRSEFVTLRPHTSGLGFHVRGSTPVIIHGVDKASAASRVGLLSGSCLLRVGERDVMRTSHEEVVAAIKTDIKESAEEEGGSKVTLKVSCGRMEQLVQYEYETSDHIHQEVYERTLESPYTFSLPARYLRLLKEEAERMAASLESCGLEGPHLKTYIGQLKSLAKHYGKIEKILLSPHYPTYKLYGPAHPPILDPCPCNLHTYHMDVLTPSSSALSFSSSFSSSTSSNNARSTSLTDDDSPSPTQQVEITNYLISTMAIPSFNKKNFSTQDMDTLSVSSSCHGLLSELKNRLQELTDMHVVTQRLLEHIGHPSLSQESTPSLSDHSGLLHLPPTLVYDDITPSSTPPSSPALHRSRHPSLSDPIPAIRLEAEGFVSKVDELLGLLDSRLLLNVSEKVTTVVRRDTKATLQEFSTKLRSCQEAVKRAALSPGEGLGSAMQTLLEKAHSYSQEVALYLTLSLAECDNFTLLQVNDMLFSQCLVALATAFSHQLLAACRGHLNCEAEYGRTSEDVSLGWLQLLASKGVLFHLETSMAVQKSEELMSLRDLHFVAKQLKGVSLRVVAMETTAELSSEFPEISVSGSRTDLKLTFALPPHLFTDLPLTLRSSSGVKVHPVLFNKGLLDVPEGSDVYSWEKRLNSASLQDLKEYYRQFRSFRLDRSLLWQTSEEKTQAIEEVSQPLNALDLLVRQMEVAVKEPARPGLGVSTLTAELATRMGALRVCVCDSGVYRSGMACTLEQAMILGRCHRLPLKNFRVALNSLRRKGAFSLILGKNQANIDTAFPQQPPKLYQPPTNV